MRQVDRLGKIRVGGRDLLAAGVQEATGQIEEQFKCRPGPLPDHERAQRRVREVPEVELLRRGWLLVRLKHSRWGSRRPQRTLVGSRSRQARRPRRPSRFDRLPRMALPLVVIVLTSSWLSPRAAREPASWGNRGSDRWVLGRRSGSARSTGVSVLTRRQASAPCIREA